MEFKHTPIMVNEVLSGLNINPDGIYLDATIGGGGHSEEILKRLSISGRLIGLDKDEEAIEASKERLKDFKNLTIYHTDFKDASDVFEYEELGNIDGVLIDLGVSSYQLDNSERGFSFRFDSKLDMRMDRTQKLSAYEVVNTYNYEKLVKIFFEYGEEEFGKIIAKNIIKQRDISPIKTTKELADIIEKSLPKKIIYKRNGGYKKVFQAIRIEVNHELEKLDEILEFFVSKLKVGGRIAVLTFHSLEDRIVKNVFRKLCIGCVCPPHIPICICGIKPTLKLVNNKPICASEEEQSNNSRSTSAKLRVAERI